MTGSTDVPPDPTALIRGKPYRALLLIAALIGVVISAASWAFLELVHLIQVGVYEDLPSALGYAQLPWWWPVPVLAVAGTVAGFAIWRLPGHGGHVPYEGINAGATNPVDLPGILLAAFATLGLGLVLGPEGPLIALSTGLAVLAVRHAKQDIPDQTMSVLAASAAFAALASVFGSPIVGTVILIEAAGLGGPMLSLVLLPGLLSAGIGAVVFIGIRGWSGLDSDDYALVPFSLADYTTLHAAELAWAVALAVPAAVLTAIVIAVARVSDAVVRKRPLLLLPVVGVLISAIAITFGQVTDRNELVILFSGQEAMGSLFAMAPEVSLATLGLLLALKSLAWSLSLGSFRGGPTFPALFVGAVGGLIAADLPGLSQTPAVVIVIAAMAVSVLRLPLSSVVLTLLLTADAGTATAPLAIASVVTAYVTTLAIDARGARIRLAGSSGEIVRPG